MSQNNELHWTANPPWKVTFKGFGNLYHLPLPSIPVLLSHRPVERLQRVSKPTWHAEKEGLDKGGQRPHWTSSAQFLYACPLVAERWL